MTSISTLWRQRQAKPQRRTELGLLLLVGFITICLYILARLGRYHSLPANVTTLLGVIFGLLALAHLALRRYAPYANPLLLPLAGLLNGIGYVFIARLDETLAGAQALWTLVGIVAFIVVLVLIPRVRDLERYRYITGLSGIFLLLLPLKLPGVPNPLSYEVNGARIWVRLGSLTFQPGELAKIALAIFLASYLVEKRELLGTATRRVAGVMVPDPRHFAPVLLAWGCSLLIMFYQKDLGSSLLFFALFLVLLWVGTGRGMFLGIGTILFAFGSTLAYHTFAHVRERVALWHNPFVGSGNTQLAESIYALGSGGLTGVGIALGSPDRIPYVKTDFIFSAIGEEMGFIGTVAIIICYLLIIGIGLRIAITAEHPFEKLLAAGLTAIIGIQTFIIVGGVSRLIPLTGITLPFVSYGGSSLVANYVLLALLLRTSHDISPEARI